jgi:redox-sensing transcriptional repressor
VNYFTTGDCMLPVPSIERLSGLIPMLLQLKQQGIGSLSSARLSVMTGIPAHTLRKDISLIGNYSGGSAGYEPGELAQAIESELGLTDPCPVCIVGLGRLGQALLNYTGWEPNRYLLKAGFDSDINVVERMRLDIPCFPAYDMPEVLSRLKITVAILTVPEKAVGQSMERLTKGGIEAVLNFTPVYINPEKYNIPIRNMHLLGELRVLSTLLMLKNNRRQP